MGVHGGRVGRKGASAAATDRPQGHDWSTSEAEDLNGSSPPCAGIATAPHESKDCFLRRNFSSSRLVRLLSDWAPVEPQASRQDFAERLSQWLDLSDAITLHAAHQSIKPAVAGKRPGARAVQTQSLDEEFHRVRAALVQAIAASGALPVRDHRDRSLLPMPPGASAPDAGFAPYQQRYLDQQRQMALRIEALRGHVRHAVAAATPRLAQLAAMDAVLEQMLGAREQKMMGTVPVVLERRFEQLRSAHQLAQDAAQQPDDPASWRQPGGWQHRFGKELEAALLAELEVRLQPVTGLMEALRNEGEKTR